MGGGTGRGAAPVVADVARQQGTCTISIAMVPEQPTSQPMLLVRSTRRCWDGHCSEAHKQYNDSVAMCDLCTCSLRAL
jgi:hypothetical protein